MNFASKYRPVRFSEVIGQKVSVQIMTNSVLLGKPRSMLLSGIRGTGKTTLARLYSKALNCDKFQETGDVCCECFSCQENGDPLELDAASNNGVDDIRNLEHIIYQLPKYKYKVVILDECHMLSTQAQSALLKTLEESPPHVVFMLVTTNPEKLLGTIRSRVLSMPVRPLSTKDAAIGIDRIVKGEGKATEELFVDNLALQCDGSIRDCYQMLEQLFIISGDEPLKVSMLEEAVGVVSINQYKDLASMLCAKSYGVQQGCRIAFDEIDRWNKEGYDLRLLFLTGIPVIIRDFMIFLSGCYSDSIEYKSGISNSSFASNLTIGLGDTHKFIDEWENTEEIMRNTNHPRIIWEMYIVKIFS